MSHVSDDQRLHMQLTGMNRCIHEMVKVFGHKGTVGLRQWTGNCPGLRNQQLQNMTVPAVIIHEHHNC